MVFSGPPTPAGGSLNVPVPSQDTQYVPVPSLVSPCPQMSNMNIPSDMHNMSSVLGQSFGNSVNPVFSSLVSSQRGGVLAGLGAELDPLANVGNGMSHSMPSSSALLPGNPGASEQFQRQQFQNPSISDQSRQLEQQNFPNSQQTAQQFSGPPKAHIGGLPSLGPVKLEPQVINEQLHSVNNVNSMKLEPQQIPTQSMRNLPLGKMEPQGHPNSTLFLQQQQQLMQLARQSSSPAQLALLQQQKQIQLQQQQQQKQQQLAKVLAQQRVQLPHHFQQHSMAPKPTPMKSGYEPGTCSKILTQYMYQQQHRPQDNNIEFWRKFVDEYFARNAKKKWCVSMCGSGRQTTVFPQEIWHCDLCNRKPGRGFEATREVLPRLFKIEYESGTLEELLYVDMPREYQNSSGQIVLDYAKAVQENVFDQLRVVHEGQLRVVFSPDLKICSWEFCARRREELVPRRLFVPQASQLGAVVKKYQAATQNASPTAPELQNYCNMFLATAGQLVRALEVPLVNDLGYTKRYVRCLQISEVVNCMKDLIDYSLETGIGPMESLEKFPQRAGASSAGPTQAQLPNEQLLQQRQQLGAATPNMNGSHQSSSPQSALMQLPATSNGTGPANNPFNPTSTSELSPPSAITSHHHQNSMNLRRQYSMSNPSSKYNGGVHNPSPGSSGSIAPIGSGNNSNNILQTSQSALAAASHVGSANARPDMTMQQAEPELNNMAQSSVQKILQNVMSGPLQSACSVRNDAKSGNGLENGGYCSMEVGGLGQSAMMVNGFKASSIGRSSSMNGRGGTSSLLRDRSMNRLQQQDLGNQMMNGGFGPASNGARSNNLQYEWKPSQ